jgi:MerR family transcriptional regulator, heat shock protein HspR
MFLISQVAKKLNIHIQTLRNWEKNGLIKPNRIGQVRIFSHYDLEKCSYIKRFSKKGVQLSRIKQLVIWHDNMKKIQKLEKIEKIKIGG